MINIEIINIIVYLLYFTPQNNYYYNGFFHYSLYK